MEDFGAKSIDFDVLTYLHYGKKNPAMVRKIFSASLLKEIKERANEISAPTASQVLELFKNNRKRPPSNELVNGVPPAKKLNANESSTDSSDDENPAASAIKSLPSKQIANQKASSSDDSDSEEEPPKKKTLVAVKSNVKNVESSSDSDSDDETPAKGSVAAVNSANKKPTPANAAVNKKAKSSSESSSDSDDETAKKPVVTPAKPVSKKAESSSDSESDEAPVKKINTAVNSATKKPTPANAAVNKKTKSSSESSSDSDEETAKKPVVTPVKPISKNDAASGGSDSDEAPIKKSSTRKSNEPFRRVLTNKQEVPEKFRDNSFDPSFDKWGYQAHEKLSKVQGKNFRHEKTKKKKGSYGGGPISMGVNSTRFSDSE